MTGIGPSLPPTLPVSAQLGQVTVTATLANPADAARVLAQLSPGQTVEASLVSLSGTTLSLRLGTLAQPLLLRLSQPVTLGGGLALQILPQANPLAFRVIALDMPGGRPQAAPSVGAGGAAQAGAPLQAPATTPGGSAPAQPAPVQGATQLGPAPAWDGFDATLLRASPPQPGQPFMANGTQLAVRVLGFEPPPPPAATAPPAQGTPTPAQPQTPTPAQPQAPAGSAAARPSPVPVLPQGSEAAAGPPAQPTPERPLSLTGTVAVNSNGGQTLLRTPLGLISLDLPQLVPGTGVRLDIIGARPADPRPLLPEAGAFPALKAALDALAAQAPATAQTLAAHLPQPGGADFALSLFSIFAAVRQGRISRHLGLDQARGELAELGRGDVNALLDGEMETLSTRTTTETARESWQSWILPVLVEGRVERLRVVTRRPPDEGEEGEDAPPAPIGTRFLIDLDLTRLGALQLDGLVKREAKRFDLIIRTEAPLPPSMRRDIAGLFGRALEGLGFAGEASFQGPGRFAGPAFGPAGPDLTV